MFYTLNKQQFCMPYTMQIKFYDWYIQMFISPNYADYVSPSNYDAAEHLDECLDEMKLSRGKK